MSSTGISEFSEYGLTSGEVTPNKISGNETSPQPVDHSDDEESSTSFDLTPMSSIKGSEHTHLNKIEGEGSICSETSDVSTPSTVHSEM